MTVALRRKDSNTMRACLFLAAAAAAAAFPAAAQEEPEPAAAERGLAETVGAALDEIESGDEPDQAAPPPAEAEAEAEAEPVDAAAEPLGEAEADAQPEAAADEPPPEAPAGEVEAEAPAEETAEAPAPPPPLTAEERAAVAEAADRGRRLSAVARAAILTTRDMLSRISDPEAEGIAGWVAEPEGNGMAVTYFAEAEDGPVAVYRGRILGGRVVSRDLYLAGERPPLAGEQARMAAARAAAEALEHERCGEAPFNVLVLPPEAPDAPIQVYQLTAPTAPGRFPFGGHYRTTVSPDGDVEADRSFARSCLVVEPEPVAEGAEPRPIAVTHLLDPAPTEIHVFLARLTGRPLLVATGDPARLWLVTGEDIAEIRD